MGRTKAPWLHGGRVRSIGDADEVVQRYRRSIDDAVDPPEELPGGGTRHGSREVEILSLRVLGRDGHEITTIRPGERFSIEIRFIAREDVADPIFQVSLRRRGGSEPVLDVNTASDGLETGRVAGEGRAVLELEALGLPAAEYGVDAGIFQRDWEKPYDYLWQTRFVRVADDAAAASSHRWTIS